MVRPYAKSIFFPYMSAIRPKGTKKTAYRLRVGDYRFFYIIDLEKKIVKVTEFLTAEQAHRKYGRM